MVTEQGAAVLEMGSGAINAWLTNQLGGIGRQEDGSLLFKQGQIIGDLGSLLTGGAEIMGGSGLVVGGVGSIVVTGGGIVFVGSPGLVASGIGVTAHGMQVVGTAMKNCNKPYNLASEDVTKGDSKSNTKKAGKSDKGDRNGKAQGEQHNEHKFDKNSNVDGNINKQEIEKMSPDDVGKFLGEGKNWHKTSAKSNFIKQFRKELKGDKNADFFIDKHTGEIYLKSNKSKIWIKTGQNVN